MRKISGKILVVEDDIIDRMAFERFATTDNFPYDFVIASSVTEASAILAKEKFDAILLDYMLGDGTAFDLFDKVQKTPFIIVTGAGDEEISVLAIKSGAYDYLIKDNDHNYLKILPVTLENAIRHLRAEEELVRYREHLEELVAERTAKLQQEIVERERIEIALRDSEKKWQLLYNNLPGGSFSVNNNYIIEDLNNLLCSLTGFTREELIGQSCQIICPKGPHNCPIFDLGIDQINNDESAIKTKNNHLIPVIKSARKIPLRGKDIIIENFQDITELKRTQWQLQQYATELEQSYQELQQFAFIASHDLQEPLRMVSTYVQLLAQRYNGQLDANANDFIGYAVDGANRMRCLINDLLDYSRIGARIKEFEPTDCNITLNQTIADLQINIKENSASITHSTLPVIMADATQLRQLFQNLISNAIKFRTEAPPRVHISAKLIGNIWLFTVQDNGIGIAPEYANNIFEIFRRLHNTEKYPGTGIGLAVCKKIVKRHGGRIWVESAPGKGAKFLFTIPANKENNNLEPG